MTASNLDFFPCRVKLLGSTYSSSIAPANTSSNTTVTKLQSIRRNLFGSPDPGDMKALYQKEDERIRSYVLQRYNLDTKELQSTNNQQCKQFPTDKTYSPQNTITPIQPSELPSLIHHELLQHDDSTINDNVKHDTSFLESVQKKEIVIHANFSSKFLCKRNKSKKLFSTGYKHKQKYHKQLPIKRSFKIRKNLVCMQNSS